MTYDSESSNDYDIVLNENDLMRVSSDGDDADMLYLAVNNNTFNLTSQAQHILTTNFAFVSTVFF
jgi:hypothetical protein